MEFKKINERGRWQIVSPEVGQVSNLAKKRRMSWEDPEDIWEFAGNGGTAGDCGWGESIVCAPSTLQHSGLAVKELKTQLMGHIHSPNIAMQWCKCNDRNETKRNIEQTYWKIRRNCSGETFKRERTTWSKAQKWEDHIWYCFIKKLYLRSD